jgi:hypothetical protein
MLRTRVRAVKTDREGAGLEAHPPVHTPQHARDAAGIRFAHAMGRVDGIE